MGIIEALKTENLRISCGRRWMYYDSGAWVIREHRPYAKKTTVLIITSDENEAIKVLLNE